MSKELPRKSDMKAFVEAIRKDAYASIRDRYATQINNALHIYLNENNMLTKIDQYAKLYTEAIYIKQDIGNGIPGLLNAHWQSSDVVYIYDIRETLAIPERDDYIELVKNHLYEQIINRRCIPSITALKEAENKEINETATAYSTVLNNLQALHTPKECLQYLTTCGFDISKIKRNEEVTTPVNKDKLFPCLKQN